MGKKLPQKLTAGKLGVTIKTLDRWREDPKLNFPPCVIINGRKYDDEDALEEWDRWRAANPEPKRKISPPQRKPLKTASA